MGENPVQKDAGSPENEKGGGLTTHLFDLTTHLFLAQLHSCHHKTLVDPLSCFAFIPLHPVSGSAPTFAAVWEWRQSRREDGRGQSCLTITLLGALWIDKS